MKLRLTEVGRLLLVLLVVAATRGFAFADSQQTRPKASKLRPGGAAIERSIAGSDTHLYTIKLKAGQYCSVSVRQSAIDLVATLAGPDGGQVARVDTPLRTTGDELVRIVAASSGTHSLTIRAGWTEAPKGAYHIRVDSLRQATDRDRRRTEALRVFERAEQWRGTGTAESLDQAQQAYEQALTLFQANHDAHEAATVLLRTADVLGTIGHLKRAGDKYGEAAAAFHELKDQAREAEALSSTDSGRSEALGLAQLSKDRTVEALALLRQSGAHYWARKYAEGKASGEQAKAIFEQLNNRWGVALALRTTGMSVQDVDSQKAALGYYQEALALAHAGGYLDLEANTLGSIAWSAIYSGEMPTALAHYTRGVQLAKQAGALLTEAWQSTAIGQIYQRFGQARKALPYFERTIELTRLLQVSYDEGVALGSMGQAYSTLGDWAKGVEYRQQALQIFQRIKDRQEEAVMLLSLGMEYEQAGSLAEALDHFNRALGLLRELGNRRREGWTLSRLGSFYAARGDYRRALEMDQQALALSRSTNDGIGEIHALVRLGDVSRLLGEAQRALEFYDQALASARAKGLRNEEAITLVRMGYVLSDQNDHDRARTRYGEALSIVRGESTDMPGGESAVLKGLGATRLATGDLEGALAAYEEALKLAGAGAQRVDVLIGLGETLVRAGQVQRALALYGEALQLARANQLQAAEAIVLRNFMTGWNAAGRPALAAFYGKQAVNLFQAVRANILELEPQTQRAYLRSKEDVYRELADLLVTAGRLPEAQQVLDFLKQEELRDYVRRDAEGGGAAGRLELSPSEAAWQQRYNEIADRIVALGRERSRLSGLSSRLPEDDARLAQLDADMRVAARAYEMFLVSLAAEFGTRPDAAGRIHDIREEQGLMAHLRKRPGTVALYTIAGQRRYSVIVITPDVIKAAEFPVSAADLGRKVLAFLEVLKDPRRDPLPLARELYNIIVAPIAKDLEQAGAKTLMWSLDGVLRYLPITALHDGRGYLLERYTTAVYTPASKDRLGEVPRRWQTGLGVGVSKATEGFDPLPAVVDELHSIIRDDRAENADGGVLRGRVLLDESFTEAALRAELRQSPSVVHVATHFQFRPGNETDSFLLLGDGRRLTVADLKQEFAFFVGVDLLTLSACNTATGGAGATGEEIESFAALAQQKGASTVIATLWPVADRSTRELMERFYRARSGSDAISKADALRNAQLSLLRGETTSSKNSTRRGLTGVRTAPTGLRTAAYEHPYYWAPFLLIGNWQ